MHFDLRLEKSFDFSGPEYRALFMASSATAFQHPLWMKHLFSDLAVKRKAEPVIISVHDENGRLCAILPLVRRRKAGIRIVEAPDFGITDYVGPIVRDGASLLLCKMNDLARKIEALLPAHDVLRIKHVRDDQVNGWSIFFPHPTQIHNMRAHSATLKSDYHKWRSETLDDSFRRKLERKKKRMLRDGPVMVEKVTDPAAIEQLADRIAEIRKGRFDNDLLQQESIRQFYTAIAQEGTLSGFVVSYLLKFAGEEIGWAFGLVHHGRFHLLMFGCDYTNHARYSPGLIMIDLMIEKRIGEGDAVFDFTIGDEPYKQNFGTRPTAMRFIEQPKTVLGHAAIALRNCLRLLRTRHAEGGRRYGWWGNGGKTLAETESTPSGPRLKAARAG